jgi:hypothetical protein
MESVSDDEETSEDDAVEVSAMEEEVADFSAQVTANVEPPYKQESQCEHLTQVFIKEEPDVEEKYTCQSEDQDVR